MCPANGMARERPGWGKGGGWILEETKPPLSMNPVGLNEPVISQSWGRGIKGGEGPATVNLGLQKQLKPRIWMS